MLGIPCRVSHITKLDGIVILFAAVMAGIFAPKITPYIMRWLNKDGKK